MAVQMPMTGKKKSDILVPSTSGFPGTRLFLFLGKETSYMKYCPYCGEALSDPQVSFCPECGKTLAGTIPPSDSERPAPGKKQNSAAKRKKDRKRKAVQSASPEMASTEVFPQDEGYDGYYDDILPSDDGGSREGIDKGLVKKIILLLGIVLLVIGACVAMMYLI